FARAPLAPVTTAGDTNEPGFSCTHSGSPERRIFCGGGGAPCRTIIPLISPTVFGSRCRTGPAGTDWLVFGLEQPAIPMQQADRIESRRNAPPHMAGLEQVRIT